jgi:hypothetical protein
MKSFQDFRCRKMGAIECGVQNLGFKIISKYFGVRIFGIFGTDDFDLQVVGEKEDFRGRRPKSKMKKYGLFRELFFVDGEEVRGDWAICNKRFVTDFLGDVVGLRGE